jgi:hypothetical protein
MRSTGTLYFDSSLVLLDGLVVFTRTEVSVSLKRDREMPLSRRASGGTKARPGAQKRTYSFLSLFCLDAFSLYTLCAFESPRHCLFFLYGGWLCGDCTSNIASRLGSLFAFGSHL